MDDSETPFGQSSYERSRVLDAVVSAAHGKIHINDLCAYTEFAITAAEVRTLLLSLLSDGLIKADNNDTVFSTNVTRLGPIV